jgi:hypothetical protein
MKYQLSDLVNGLYGDKYSTLQEAEVALSEEIKEGKRLNLEMLGTEIGSDGKTVEEFITIEEIE